MAIGNIRPFPRETSHCSLSGRYVGVVFVHSKSFICTCVVRLYCMRYGVVCYNTAQYNAILFTAMKKVKNRSDFEIRKDKSLIAR